MPAGCLWLLIFWGLPLFTLGAEPIPVPQASPPDVIHKVFRYGSSLVKINEFNQASVSLDSAYKGQISSRNFDGASAVMYQKALLYFHQGNQSAALEIIKKGLQLPGISTAQRGKMHAALANIYASRENFSSALIHSRLAVQNFHRCGECAQSLNDALIITASLQISLQQTTDARKILNQVSLPSPALHIQYGRWYAEKMAPEEAIRQFHQALILAIPNFTNRNYLSLPQVHQIPAKPEVLEALLGKAAAFEQFYQQTRRTSLLTNALRHYQLAYQSLARLALTPNFLDFNPIRLEKTLQQLNQAFLSLAIRLDTPDEVLVALHTAKQVAMAWDCPTCHQPVDTIGLQKRLQRQLKQQDAILLDYSLGLDSLFICVVSPTRIHLVGIAAPEKIDNKVKDYLDRLARRQLPQEKSKLVVAQSRQWYQTLIQPVEPYLPRSGQLIIHATHPLSLLPFDAFLDEKDWLIKRYAISYTPSLSHWLQASPRKKKNSPSIISGFAVEQALPKLSIVKADRQVYGNTATLNQLVQLAKQSKMIQLSLNENAELSLYDADGQELQSLHVAELLAQVNLRGAILQHSMSSRYHDYWTAPLLGAGTETVIRMRWELHQDIINSFVHFVKAGETSASAIRKAKLQWLEQGTEAETHPYYWAGLELYGRDVVLVQRHYWRWISIILAGLLIGFFLRRAGKI